MCVCFTNDLLSREIKISNIVLTLIYAVLPTDTNDTNKEINAFGAHLILDLSTGSNLYFAIHIRFLGINETCVLRFICMTHADISYVQCDENIPIRITGPIVSLIH